ncbi:MAG: molybdopterin-guanine dinucleotide biosynthesis protein B [Bacilli bacterium]
MRAERNPAVLQFSGYKHTGKTTLIVRLTAECAQRGLRVGCLKHDGHDFRSSPEGADTARYLDAGAVSVGIADTLGHYMIERRGDGAPPVSSLVASLGSVDVVFLEGYKTVAMRKIVVLGADLRRDDHYALPDFLQHDGAMLHVLAFAAPEPPLAVAGVSLPVYHRNDIDGFMAILDRLMLEA